MYPTSDIYKEKVRELDRVWEAKVDIEHEKGTLHLTDKDIVLGGLSVTEKTQPGEDFSIGGTVASDLSLKILNRVDSENLVLGSDVFNENKTTMPLNWKIDPKKLQGETIAMSCDVEVKNAKDTHSRYFRIGAGFTVYYEDDTRQYVEIWRFFNNEGEFFKGRIEATRIIKNKPIKSVTKPSLYIQLDGDIAKVGRLKIEKGSIATPWEPDYSDIDFTGAKIKPYVMLTEDDEGRNLFLDTDHQFDWDISDPNTWNPKDNNIRLFPDQKMLRGREVTMSFEAKTEDLKYTWDKYNPWLGFEIRLDFADGSYSYAIQTYREIKQGNSDGWVKYSRTVTIPDKEIIPNNRTATVLMIGATGKVSIKNIKLELGPQATDWRPAVEDWSEPIPLGIFNVDEQSRFRSTIELKAMDNMIKLDRPYSYSKLSYPATLYQIYTDICNVCNVLPVTHDFLHKDLLIQNRPEGDYSCRDILGFVAQLSGSFAKITRDGKVALKWYEPTELELVPMNRFEFKPSDEQISITGVMAKESIENEGEDTKERTYIAGTDEYAIDLTENPLLQGDYETVLPAIFNKIRYIKFNPYTAKWQGDPSVEAGDMVKHTDVDSNIFNTIITGSTYKYRGASNMEAKAKSEASKGYKGSTSKKLANVVQRIVDNRAEIEDKLTSVEQAQLNATEMMANMLGGHLIEDKENGILYVADNTDLSQAQKVWKWGIGGFGYSENGVDGPYTTAITADGSIVAMLVAAHIITADMVRTGLLQSEDGSTWINLDNGFFNLKNVVYDKEGFKLLGDKYIFDETGARFKAVGITIEDELGTPVFYSNSEGNLTVSASFTTGKDKNRYVGIADNGIWINSETSGELYRIIGEIQGQALPYTDIEGMYINHGAKKFTAIGGFTNDQALKECIFIDVGNVLGYGSNYPIIALEGMKFEGPVVRYGDANHYGHTRFHGMVNFDNNIRSKYLLNFGPHGESTASIGTSHGDRILIIQADYNGLMFNNRLGNSILMYAREEGEWWFHRSIKTTRDLFVNGSKNVIHETKNYGERLINAYETAEYYFGDIGSGKINEDGECIIYIDDIFQECINTEINYHVFTQIYNGEIDSIKKERNYFIVFGEPGTEFSWELKAKRLGYEYDRLEQPDKHDLGEDDSVNFEKEMGELREKDSELKNIYDDELSFDLVSLLLEEVY